MMKVRRRTTILYSAIVICSILVFSSGGHSETYKWVDENGVIHFSDTPPPDKKVETLEDLPANKMGEPIPIPQSDEEYSDGNINSQINTIEAKIKKCEEGIIDCENNIKKYQEQIEIVRQKKWDIPRHSKSREQSDRYYRLRKNYDSTIDYYRDLIKDSNKQINEYKLEIANLNGELRELQSKESTLQPMIRP